MPVRDLEKVGDRPGAGRGHEGVDLTAKDRTVYSASAGRVLRVEDARQAPKGSGRWRAGPWWVDVEEVDQGGKKTGKVLRYLHLDAVRPGLQRGSILTAGEAFGSFWEITNQGYEGHLHFEVRAGDWNSKATPPDYGAVIDPMEWLKGASWEGGNA